MQFQKLAIHITLATLALAAQQHAATANPASTSHALTRYEFIVQQLGLQNNQPQNDRLQSTQPYKSMTGTTRSSSTSHALTRHELILQQLGLQNNQPQAMPPQTTQPQTTQPQTTQPQTTQPQTTQPQSQKSLSTNQAKQTFFSHPPQLVRVAAFPSGGNVSSTYEFTLTVPANAGQPLQAVTISQAINAETVRFNATNTKAFLGRRLVAGSEIQLASLGGEQPANPGEATIVFNQPVQPGNTVTIALPVRNSPYWGGVYLFGVTAHPAGENGLGQFLGYGRIHVYGNSN